MDRNKLMPGGVSALRKELQESAEQMRRFGLALLAMAVRSRNAVAAFALMVWFLVTGDARADYSGFVTFTNGTVEFTPGVAISPVIIALVAAIGVSIGVFVLWMGTKWIFRAFKGTK